MERKDIICQKLERFVISTRQKIVFQGLTSMQRKFLYKVCREYVVTKRRIVLDDEVCSSCKGFYCPCCNNTGFKRGYRLADLVIVK